jgi:hypothetical protein
MTTVSLIAGGPDVSKVSTDSPYTATLADQTIRIDCTSGSFVLNLPTAVGNTKVYTIIRTDIILSTNTLTIDASSTQTIDGNLTHFLWPAESIVLQSDGANWVSLARTPVGGNSYFVKGATADRRYLAGVAPGRSTTLVSASTGPTINFLRAFPFLVEKTTKFDLLSIYIVTVGSAGSVARLGIYRDDGNLFPGSLIYETGSIDTAAGTGWKDNTITSSLQVFQPGMYWLAAVYGVATPLPKVINSLTGLFTLGQDSTISATNGAFYYQQAHTFGALPQPFTGTLQTATPSATSGHTAIFLRPI